jgi:hypothetical protein
MFQLIEQAKNLHINDPVMIARYIRANDSYWGGRPYQTVKAIVLDYLNNSMTFRREK